MVNEVVGYWAEDAAKVDGVKLVGIDDLFQ